VASDGALTPYALGVISEILRNAFADRRMALPRQEWVKVTAPGGRLTLAG
jgi:hypothetical protein